MTTTRLPMAATVQDAPMAEGSRQGSGKFMYWRKRDGTIITGPAWPIEYVRQQEKGLVPLSRYGQFSDEPKVWNIYQEPYRQLFQRGGVGEFTLAQVLENGWHRKSPYPGVVFPQLKDVDLATVDVMCPYCRKMYLRTAGHESDLHRHESVAHKEVAQSQQLARLIGEVTGAQTVGMSDKMADVLKLLVEQQTSISARISEQDRRMEMLLGHLTGAVWSQSASALANQNATTETPPELPANVERLGKK